MIQVSLKSYGLSAHQRDFNEHSARIEAALVACLGQHRIAAVTFFAAATAYPGQREWSLLKDNLGAVLEAFRTTSHREFKIQNAWVVAVHPFPERDGPFSPQYLSYIFVTTAPYHKNEDKNLLDKLDDACANFTRHPAALALETLRVVFVHVPETASLALCKEWAHRYFTDSPKTPLGAIILYQPTVAMNPEMTETGINHCVAMVTGPLYKQWYQYGVSRPPVIPLKVFVGSVSTEPTKIMLANGKHTTPVDGVYIYQQGHLYIMTQSDEQGNLSAQIRNIASGIFTHAVVRFSPGEELILDGFFPPRHELLLW